MGDTKLRQRLSRSPAKPKTAPAFEAKPSAVIASGGNLAIQRATHSDMPMLPFCSPLGGEGAGHLRLPFRAADFGEPFAFITQAEPRITPETEIGTGLLTITGEESEEGPSVEIELRSTYQDENNTFLVEEDAQSTTIVHVESQTVIRINAPPMESSGWVSKPWAWQIIAPSDRELGEIRVARDHDVTIEMTEVPPPSVVAQHPGLPVPDTAVENLPPGSALREFGYELMVIEVAAENVPCQGAPLELAEFQDVPGATILFSSPDTHEWVGTQSIWELLASIMIQFLMLHPAGGPLLSAFMLSTGQSLFTGEPLTDEEQGMLIAGLAVFGLSLGGAAIGPRLMRPMPRFGPAIRPPGRPGLLWRQPGRAALAPRPPVAVANQVAQLAASRSAPRVFTPRTLPEFVPATTLEQRPATMLQSAAAGQVPGATMVDPFTGQTGRVLSRAGTTRSLRTGTDAAAAEDFVYKDGLRRGYIGIQQPGHTNAPGLDALMARRTSAGQFEIVFQDATLNPRKAPYRTPPQTWVQEAASALQNLSLGDAAVEADIRAAFAARRFVMETTLVQIESGGVRFTPL